MNPVSCIQTVISDPISASNPVWDAIGIVYPGVMIAYLRIIVKIQPHTEELSYG